MMTSKSCIVLNDFNDTALQNSSIINSVLQAPPPRRVTMDGKTITTTMEIPTATTAKKRKTTHGTKRDAVVVGSLDQQMIVDFLQIGIVLLR